MAKKKQIIINNQELTPTVLAVKEDKKTVSMIGFLWITLIFIAFIAASLYLPDLSKTLKKYLNYLPFVDIEIDEEETPIIAPSTNNNTTPIEEKTEETTENSETTTNNEQAYLIIDNKILAIKNINPIS